jgi:hypothetical protein
MNSMLERMWNEVAVAWFELLSWNLDGLMRATNNPGHCSWYRGSHSNRASPKLYHLNQLFSVPLLTSESVDGFWLSCQLTLCRCMPHQSRTSHLPTVSATWWRNGSLHWSLRCHVMWRHDVRQIHTDTRVGFKVEYFIKFCNTSLQNRD